MATEANKRKHGGSVKSILNVVNGVEIECYDETPGQSARVVIRNSKGHKVTTVIASIRDGCIFFDQRLPERETE